MKQQPKNHDWIVWYKGPDAWKQGMPEDYTEWGLKRSLEGVVDDRDLDTSIASFVGWTLAGAKPSQRASPLGGS